MKKKKRIRIKSIAQLRKLAIEGIEVFIPLMYNLRSTKYIAYWPDVKKYYVSHYIDSFEEEITEKQLLASNIGKTMKKGNLFAEVE